MNGHEAGVSGLANLFVTKRAGSTTKPKPADGVSHAAAIGCTMSGFSIVGSGRYLPGRPYTNDDLARVMDTNDEWVRQRTGIQQRHFCPEGKGASDLAIEAARVAIEDAGKVPEEIDVQRAREILEELRRRLSEPSRPRLEKDYLERLLERF